MNLRITEIADIQIGYQHRDSISIGSVGTHQVIQMKDIDRDGAAAENRDIEHENLFAQHFTAHAPFKLWAGSLYMVTPKGDAARYCVEPGDVLFVSRGQRNFAVPMVPAYVQPFPESWKNIIALYYFYILKIKRPDVSPEYLAWFINQPQAQRFLEPSSQGSHMKLISMEEFKKLSVPVPPISRQDVIVKLELLRLKEEECMRRLLKEKKNLVQTLCQRAASQS